MDDIRSLKANQLDALREVANIGAGHAATALSQMTGGTIMISVPTINIARLEDVPPQITAPEEPVAAVLMNMLGDLTGRTLLVFPRPTALRLAGLMLNRRAETEIDLGEIEQSAIKEAGNILSGAYMNALSDFMGLMLLPSPQPGSGYVQRGADDRIPAVRNRSRLRVLRRERISHAGLQRAAARVLPPPAGRRLAACHSARRQGRVGAGMDVG